jgi:hypothetical protein
MKRCEWCNKEFEIVDPDRDSHRSTPKRFCRDRHRRRASEARKEANRLGRCPKPYKKLFRSKQEADDFISNRKLKSTFAYRCPFDLCGYHLATER